MKRRTFIQTSVAGAAALTLSGLPLSAKSYRRILGANDRIRCAMLGCYRRFPALLEGLAGAGNVDITYVCDVDARRQEAGAGMIWCRPGAGPVRAWTAAAGPAIIGGLSGPPGAARAGVRTPPGVPE